MSTPAGRRWLPPLPVIIACLWVAITAIAVVIAQALA